MNITCLDSSTLTRGDIDFAPLEALGNFSHFDRTAPSQVIERSHDAEVILTNKVVLDAGIIQSLPNLKLILV
ncbi:MAG: D-2-hydroxyacid dehydrogenase, partial [Roseibacillus sp.]